jgi:ornithine cyclodeaminase/alanine dehydrogenase-like protein (mu-crystallin family)
VTDDLEQVRYEAADIFDPVNEGILTWENVYSLANVVGGRISGRQAPADITIFKSLGVATEDVALAVRAYERAMECNAGQPLPAVTG